MARFQGLDSSDLFCFDTLALRDDILLVDGRTASKVEYDEYVVFKKDGAVSSALGTSNTAEDKDQDLSFKLNHNEETLGYQMLDLAFRRDWAMDHNGDFIQDPPRDPMFVLDGRVRRIICFRRGVSHDRREDGITLTPQDLDALDLHPATLQYSRRVTNESRFWSLDRSKLSLILSFSMKPKTPYDFMSMTYDVRSRTSTVLVRQSYNPRQHNLENLDEYDQRLEACRAHWAHPFITPVVLLQVQFMCTEEAVMENINHVKKLEWDVGSIAGFEAFEQESERRSKIIRRQTIGFNSEKNAPAITGPMSMANLMKRAHDVLKESIKLLDTVRWMERVVKLMLQAGDELAGRMSTGELTIGPDDFGPGLSDNYQGDRQDQQISPEEPQTAPPSRSSASTRQRPVPAAPDLRADPLGDHWHEIRQYLEGLQRMCMGLETDRRMSEARCRAQIDIIYSKMAQEDNVLNARMAVASSRDSSSMKALAVITAIFLPGEFLGTLFGMSMFDWQATGEDAAPADDTAPGGEPGTSTNPHDPIPVLSHLFWVYWATVIPLTVGILVAWRAWWVSQDRYFRQHLSSELSEERYWTSDGKPRQLEKSFWHDFFYLSVRRDERPAATTDPYAASLDLLSSPSADEDGMRSPRETNLRRGQISFLKSQSLRQRNAVTV